METAVRCPHCGETSLLPQDANVGWCKGCHDWFDVANAQRVNGIPEDPPGDAGSPASEGPGTWWDKQFAGTSSFVVWALALFCTVPGLIVGLIGLYGTRTPEGRGKALRLVTVSAVLLAVSWVLDAWFDVFGRR
ncbi:MAG: hypothetical protein FJX74_15935 [Armatimonadetes bacterium]|nr:hypothetical protein [Armatimonadota bacterium]